MSVDADSNPLYDEKTFGVQGSGVQGSGVQGSGRTIFYLLKIVGDVIDDELQVSDAHKCAGKKVDNGKRVLRAATGLVNNFSVAQSQGRLGGFFDEWLQGAEYCAQTKNCF